MTRATFGGGTADFVYVAPASGYIKLAASSLTAWDSEVGGTRVTDLLLGGVAVDHVTVGADGQIPSFQGPDGVLSLWVDGGGPSRSKLTADIQPSTDVGVAALVSGGTATKAALRGGYVPRFAAEPTDHAAVPAYLDVSVSPPVLKGWNGSAYVAIGAGGGTGTPGPGLPAGGDVDQIPVKASGTDYDFDLLDPTQVDTKPVSLYSSDDRNLPAVSGVPGGGATFFRRAFPAYGFGGIATSPNEQSPTLLDLDDLGVARLMWLPGYGTTVRDNAITTPFTSTLVGNSAGVAQRMFLDFDVVTNEYDPVQNQSSQMLFALPNLAWLYLDETGVLVFRFRDSAGALYTYTTTAQWTPKSRLAGYVDLQPNNAAAGNTYTIDIYVRGDDGSYSPFEAQYAPGTKAITAYKTTLVDQSGNPLPQFAYIGQNSVGSALRGGLIAVALRYGTRTANPVIDFRAADWTPNAATYTDSAGRVWTINNPGADNWVTQSCLAFAPSSTSTGGVVVPAELVTLTGSPDLPLGAPITIPAGPGLYPTLTAAGAPGFSWSAASAFARDQYAQGNIIVNLNAAPSTQSADVNLDGFGNFVFDSPKVLLGLAELATQSYAVGTAAAARAGAITAAARDAQARVDSLGANIFNATAYSSSENLDGSGAQRLYGSATYANTAPNFGLPPIGQGDGSTADLQALLLQAPGINRTGTRPAATPGVPFDQLDIGITGGLGGTPYFLTDLTDNGTNPAPGSYRDLVNQINAGFWADHTAKAIIIPSAAVVTAALAAPDKAAHITLDNNGGVGTIPHLKILAQNVTIDWRALPGGLILNGGGKPGPVPYGQTSATVATGTYTSGSPLVIPIADASRYGTTELTGNKGVNKLLIDLGGYTGAGGAWVRYGKDLRVVTATWTPDANGKPTTGPGTITVTGTIDTTVPVGAYALLGVEPTHGSWHNEPGVLGCRVSIGGLSYNDMFGPSGFMQGSAAAANIVTAGNLLVKVDGGAPTTIALASGDTPAQVVTKINAALGATATASLTGNIIKITSATAGQAASLIQIPSATGSVLANLKLAVGGSKPNVPAGNIVVANQGLISYWGGDVIDTGDAKDFQIGYYANNVWLFCCEHSNPDPFHDTLFTQAHGAQNIGVSWCRFGGDPAAGRGHYKAINTFGGNAGTGGVAYDGSTPSPNVHTFPPGYDKANTGPYAYEPGIVGAHGNPTGAPVVKMTVQYDHCDFEGLGQRSPKNDHFGEVHTLNSVVRRYGLPPGDPQLGVTTRFPMDPDEGPTTPAPCIVGDSAKGLFESVIFQPHKNASGGGLKTLKWTAGGTSPAGFIRTKNIGYLAPEGSTDPTAATATAAASEGDHDPNDKVPDFSARYPYTAEPDVSLNGKLWTQVVNGAGVGVRSQMWALRGVASVAATITVQRDGADLGPASGGTPTPAATDTINFAGPGQATTYAGRKATVTITAPADLADVTVGGTSGQLAAGKTSNVAAGGAYTSPALDTTVATPPKRWAIKAASSGTCTITYPDSTGTATTVTLLAGETLTFRQKTTNGWGAESGNKPLSQLDARYDAKGAASVLTVTPVKTADYAAATGDKVRFDTTTARVLTLPTTPADGARVGTIAVTGAAGITVNTGGSDRFDLAATGPTSKTIPFTLDYHEWTYNATDALWIRSAGGFGGATADGRYKRLTVPSPGELLTAVQYHPNATGTIATAASTAYGNIMDAIVAASGTGATAAGLDLTFTVPASRKVMVEMEVLAKAGAAAEFVRLGFVDPNGVITFSTHQFAVIGGTSYQHGRYVKIIDFSTTTNANPVQAAGATVTLRPTWSHSSSTTNATLAFGGNTGPVTALVRAL